MVPCALYGKNVRKLINPGNGLEISVMTSRGMVFSCWQPTTEEVDQIKRGEPVWLVQQGSYIPQMTLSVGREEMVVPHDICLESMTGDSDQKLMDEANAIVEQDMRNGKIIAAIIVAGTVLLFLTGLYLGAKAVFA